MRRRCIDFIIRYDLFAISRDRNVYQLWLWLQHNATPFCHAAPIIMKSLESIQSLLTNHFAMCGSISREKSLTTILQIDVVNRGTVGRRPHMWWHRRVTRTENGKWTLCKWKQIVFLSNKWIMCLAIYWFPTSHTVNANTIQMKSLLLFSLSAILRTMVGRMWVRARNFLFV